MMGLYGFSFWLPPILKALGWGNPLQIGLASSIPWGFAGLFMLGLGASADRRKAWRTHAALAAFLGGIGFAGCGLTHSGIAGLLFLALSAAGVMGMMTTQWVIPGNLLNGTAAAAGIALVNSFGNLGGFVSPILIGKVTQQTGNQAAGLYLTAAFLLAAGVALLCLRSLDGSRHR